MSHPQQPHRDPAQWEHVIRQAGPERVVALIRSWLGQKLRARVEAEDIWQETLMHSWRDAATHEWTDLQSYRRWLLGIARNRVRDAADRLTAKKRDADHERISQVELTRGTSPSRIAVRRERAVAIAETLDSLDAEVRDIIREHLLADRPMAEVAAELGLSTATAWYRFRKAVAIYASRLSERLDSQA